MVSTYDGQLVALSILVAVITSYTALDLAGRVTAAQGRLRRAWLISGAVTMGVGIWSMHFIAMSAFSLPIPIAYHVPTVLASLLVEGKKRGQNTFSCVAVPVSHTVLLPCLVFHADK